jgi:hypothetical protein
MSSDVAALRSLIATSRADTPEARRLVLRIGNTLPEGPDRVALAEDLQLGFEMFNLAAAVGLEDPAAEREAVLSTLDMIERHLAN